MTINILKKIASCLVALTTIVGSAVAFTACAPETDHPEAQITYEFNNKTYVVNYTLYRNMYPHTVKHFIELADNSFYNDLVIHDYRTNDWFTGGYGYAEADYGNNSEQMKEYFINYSKEEAYNELFKANRLSSSVYSNISYDDNGNEYVNPSDKLPTVMGEFYNNIHQQIEKGSLSAEYGCLKMFYYEKKSTQKVYVTPTSDQIILADYSHNAATSIFALQTGTSSSYSERNYTVFATLNGTEAYDDFIDAVKDYISDNHSGAASSFYSETTVRVDNNDEFSNKESDKGSDKTFYVPGTPIIVRSVKITKY